jgi:hypothetical protein
MPLGAVADGTIAGDMVNGSPPVVGSVFYASSVDGGVRVGFERWTNQAIPIFALSFEPLPTNVWTHLAATFDGTEARLYVNGEIKGRSLPTQPSGKTPLPLAWGGIQGSLDELAIYDHAVPMARIAAHIAAAKMAR